MTRPKAKGAAKGGRPRLTSAQATPAEPLPLTPYDSALLGALKAYMLHEVADDPEDVAEVEAAFAQLEAENDEALRSHGERVSDETTTRTSQAPKARERGGQKAHGPRRPKGDAW